MQDFRAGRFQPVLSEVTAAEVAGAPEPVRAHIALASIADVDLLVSWNFRHIVRLDKIRMFGPRPHTAFLGRDGASNLDGDEWEQFPPAWAKALRTLGDDSLYLLTSPLRLDGETSTKTCALGDNPSKAIRGWRSASTSTYAECRWASW